jgi:hypothetical protein
VRVPRLRIAWLMTFTAFAALNFGAMRLMADHWGRTTGFVGLGCLMANIPAVALLLGHRRGASRRFLLGFEACGAAALVLYTAGILSSNDLVWAFFRPATEVLGATVGPLVTTPRLLIAYAFFSAWASLPQLAFALAGGLFAASGGHRGSYSMGL